MVAKSQVGDRLRTLREKAGLTQKELSDKTGIKQSSISAYERDHTEPTWAAIVSICRAIGVECTALLDKPRNELAPAK